jgi:hypothetical protein
MKKLILIGFITALFNCCKNPSGLPVGAGSSEDSLKAVKTARVSTETGFMTSFREIRRNIDSIDLIQRYIRMKTQKPQMIRNEMIVDVNADIVALNSVVKKNRETIERLNVLLEKSEDNYKKLEDSVWALNNILARKQGELYSLKKELNSLNDDFMEVQSAMFFLFVQNALKDEILSEEIESAQTAYYIVGSNETLKKANIIDTKGGLIGIGKTPVVSGEAGPEQFIKLNYTQTRVIPVNSKTMKIVSSHPKNTYEIIKENNMIISLNITNPEEFWQFTKYLVVIKS